MRFVSSSKLREGRAAGSAKVRRARSSEARLRRIFFSLTKTYMEVGKPQATVHRYMVARSDIRETHPPRTGARPLTVLVRRRKI